MAHIAANLADRTESPDFAALLSDSNGKAKQFIGSVVNGRVVGVDDEAVVVDVGLKAEGRIPLREFTSPGQVAEVRVGDVVEVFVERMENRDGLASLSREKARREEVWVDLEKQHTSQTRVTGIIFGRVKGGFTVDLGGAVAFLPGSQVDIRPVRDVTPLMGTPQPFMILKMDRQRGNIVVSRRAVLEESREATRSDILSGIREGQILNGVVKNITDYGAFIDLGGVDGLLHVTDISWKRVNHPSEALTIGQSVEVQVIRYNQENQRISLGMKQLESDPWQGIAARYTVGQRMSGKVTNIADYGAFVELETGIEGLVHVSEMSWTKKNVPPAKIVTVGQEVDVQVLEVDAEKRRVSLGLKQCTPNPWTAFAETHKAGETIDGTISNVTEFGLFVGLPGEIDGMVHLSDISWTDNSEDVLKPFKKGDSITVKVLDIDTAKERVGLGVKQLTEDPTGGTGHSSSSSASSSSVSKGTVMTGTVKSVTDKGIVLTLADDTEGFIKKGDLSRERSEQRPDRFAVGEKVDAKVIGNDAKAKQVLLSIKQMEIDLDKQAMEEFGSTESGASLGDILGAALKSVKPSDAAKEKPAAKKKTKTEE
jgi:small subunit ribosomal protein S1